MDAAIEALVDELQANRAMFTALCRACNAEQMQRMTAAGRWTVLDQVAHVASYDRLAIRHLTEPAGIPASSDGSMEGGDADAWNEVEVRRRQGRTSAALLAEMGDLREESLALLGAMRDDELGGDVFFPGDSRRSAVTVPLRLWLQRWSKHDMVHALAMLQAVAELAEHSDFQSWLRDDPVLNALGREERSR